MATDITLACGHTRRVPPLELEASKRGRLWCWQCRESQEMTK